MFLIVLIHVNHQARADDDQFNCNKIGPLQWKLPLQTADIGSPIETVLTRDEFHLKNFSGSNINNLSIIASDNDTIALNFRHPSDDAGNIGVRFDISPNDNVTHACIQFQLYIGEATINKPDQNTIGIGFWGGDGTKDNNGTPSFTQKGWTSRLNINGNNTTRLYSYHLNRHGRSISQKKCHPYLCEYGQSSSLFSKLPSNKWHTITFEIKLNQNGRHNGFIIARIDDQILLRMSNLEYRTLDKNWHIRGILLSNFWRNSPINQSRISSSNVMVRNLQFYGNTKPVMTKPTFVETPTPISNSSFSENRAHDANNLQTDDLTQTPFFFSTNDSFNSHDILSSSSESTILNDNISTFVNETVTIRPLANDSDINGGDLKIIGYTIPSDGTLTYNPNNSSFNYQSDKTGIFSFQYFVRDSDMKVASGSVAITVRPKITSPMPNNDNIITSMNTSVYIDVSENDTSTMDEPLTIISYSLPTYGRLEYQEKGRFLYTPNESFIGDDEFIYTVRNRTGGIANALVTVNIRKTNDTFPNGYEQRRRIIIPAQNVDPIDVQNHPILISLNENDLRHKTDGGRISSLNGHDIRFETPGGESLEFDVETHNIKTGELTAWVSIPRWNLSQSIELYIYYGNENIEHYQGNTNDVWQNYISRWGTPDGIDSTSSGINLDVVGVGLDNQIGPAALYDGNAIMTKMNSNFQENLNELSVQAIVRADNAILGSDAGIMTEGDVDGNDSNAGITLQYLEASTSGARNLVHFKVRTDDGNAFVLSSENQHASDMQIIHGTWKSGEAPKLFLNGIQEINSTASVARGGSTVGGRSFYIGTGPRNSVDGGWQGIIDEVRFSATVLHPSLIEVETLNITDPSLFYGLSLPENPGNSENTPVALPYQLQLKNESQAEINVIEDNGLGYSVKIEKTPINGQAILFGNVIRYVANAGYVGVDYIEYSITDGINQVKGKIKIIVEKPDIENNILPNGMEVLLLNGKPVRSIKVTPGTMQRVLNEARPGDHIIMQDGNYSGLNIEKSGTKENAIVIKAENPLKATIVGTVDVTGSWIKFDQLTIRAGGKFEVRQPAANLRFDRSVFIEHTKPGIRLRAGVRNVRISRCVGRSGIEYFVYADIDGPEDHTGPKYLHIDHSFFTGYNNLSAIRLGDTSHRARAFELNAVFEYNYLDSNTGHRELIVGKSSRNWVRFNTIVGAGRGDIAIRQGSYWNIYSNFMSGAGGITMVARDNKVYNNYIENGVRGIWLMSGDNTWDKTTDQRPIYDRSERCIIANNTIVMAKRTSEGAGIGANFGQTKYKVMDCDIVNNLIYREEGNSPLISRTVETGNRFDNNIVSTNAGYTGNGVSVVDPKLEKRNGMYRVRVNSPTRGAGVRIDEYGTAKLTIKKDIFGRSRGNQFDVGAEQYSELEPVIQVTQLKDVGIDAQDPYE